MQIAQKNTNEYWIPVWLTLLSESSCLSHTGFLEIPGQTGCRRRDPIPDPSAFSHTLFCLLWATDQSRHATASCDTVAKAASPLLYYLAFLKQFSVVLEPTVYFPKNPDSLILIGPFSYAR